MHSRLRKTESGAMAIFIALVTCFVVIPLGALAVDLGMQRVSRVDAQAVADTTALDMARLLANGGTVDNTAAQAAANRSSGAVGKGLTAKVYTGKLDASSFTSDQSLGCNGTTYNAYFQQQAPATAVLVVVTNSVDFAIHGGTGGVCRSAIAAATQRACVTVDSYAAALNTGDSAVLGVLNKFLGTNINSQVLSSSGILTAGVNVLDFLNVLKTNLGVASADQVLTANATAAQINAAMVQVLNNSGNAASASILQTIGATINSTTQVSVGSLLGLTQGTGGSALATTVNPLDLIAAAAQVANGSAAVSVAVTSPPGALTGFTAAVTVGTSPRQACLGGPKVTVGQTTISATLDINQPGTLTSAVTGLLNGLTGLLSGVLQGLGGLLGGDTYTLNSVTLGQISASVNLAQASALVTGLTCNGTSPSSIQLQESSYLLPATFTIPLSVKGTHGYGGLLGIGRQNESATAKYLLKVTTDSNGKTVAASLSLPGAYTTPQAGPSNDLSLPYLAPTLSTTDVGMFAHGLGGASTGQRSVDGLLGLSTVGTILSNINATILNPLETLVMTPLFNTLTSALQTAIGTTIAGSNYLALNPANCNVPKLAG